MNATQQKAAQKAEADRRKKEQQEAAAKLKEQQTKREKGAERKFAQEPAKPQPKQEEKNAGRDAARVKELEKEVEALKATNARHAEKNKKIREAIIATGVKPEDVGSDVTPHIRRLAGGRAAEGVSPGDLDENGDRRPTDDATAPKPAHGSSAHKRTDGPFPEGGQDDPRDLPADHPTAANPDE